MATACWRRGVGIGVQAALLAVGGAALAVAEGEDACLPSALQPGLARTEFAVKYIKGKRGFGGKMDGTIVVLGDSVCFRNRRGDRAFTLALESTYARVTTRQKESIGCWAGLAVMVGTGIGGDPEQRCRRTEYLVEVEVPTPDGPERVIFKPKKAEADKLVAALNHPPASGRSSVVVNSE